MTGDALPSAGERTRRPGVGRRLLTALRRAVGPLVVAALLELLDRRAGAGVLVVVAAALVVLGLVWPAGAEALDRAIARLATFVGDALSVGLSALAWVVVVLPLWAVSRLVRLSPLDPGWARSDSAWITVPRGPGDQRKAARRMASDELPVSRSIRRRRTARWMVVAVPLLAAGTVAVVRVGGTEAVVDEVTGGPSINGLAVTDYAHEDEPWFRDYAEELALPMNLWDPYLGTQLRDLEGTYLNLVDGQRVTVQPDDPELEVWYFGGSTMFGIGQRDDHTIPSLIAEMALEDGLRIRSRNFGVPSFVNWQGTMQLAQALTDSPPPDLVVFYDGVNEWGLTYERTERGDTDPADVSRNLNDERERELYAQGRPIPPEGPIDPDAQAQLTATQYRRGVELARQLASAYGTQTVHFWQPMLTAKLPGPADQPLLERLGIDPASLPTTREQYRRIPELSGVDPIDISTVLDDADRPVFFDWGHTNEYGAGVIAEEMYRRLEPTLAELNRSDQPGS